MRCAHCEYLLFNLTHNTCPECGQPFDTEAYWFTPGSVTFNCPKCDQEYYGNDARGLPFPRQFSCVKCKEIVTLQQLRVVPKHPDAMGTLGKHIRSPWDRRQELGLLKAWWASFAQILTKPTSFFQVHSGKRFREAWIFSVISTYLGLLPMFLYQVLVMWGVGTVITMSGGPGPARPTPVPIAAFSLAYGAMGLTFPLFMPLVVGGIWACAIHLGLWAMVPDRKPLEYTFRAMLYSFAPYALCIIPFCGGSVSGVWTVVVAIIAVQTVHRTTGWRAAIAVLWPLVVLAGLFALGIILPAAIAIWQSGAGGS